MISSTLNFDVQPMQLWIWMPVSVVAASLLYLVLYSWSSGLSHIPGPWLARYTDAWALYSAVKELRRDEKSQNEYYAQLHAKYGDVIRTGPRTVIILDPAATPAVYGMKTRLHLGTGYTPFRQPGTKTSLLSIHDPETHARYRRLIANAYALSSLKGYEPNVDKMINRFMEVCDEHARKQQPLNAKLWSYYCKSSTHKQGRHFTNTTADAYDVISMLSFGKPFGFMAGDGQNVYGLVTAINKFDKYITVCSQMPWLHRIIVENPLMRKMKPSPFQAAVRSTIHTRLQEQQHNPEIKEDKEPDRSDILSYFLATHTQQPEIMTERQVIIFASVNFMAGGLGPATALAYVFRQLAHSRAIQAKLFTELKSAGITAPAQYDAVKDLPYLYGLMREAYRLHRGPSAFTLQRIAGSDGMELPGGVRLPSGTQVGCSQGAMNRDPRSWGADANAFRPERWMWDEKGESEEEFVERRKAMDRADFSFSQGSRTCLGKSVTALEMFKVIATLVLLFEFEPVEEQQDTKDGGTSLVRIYRRVQS